MGGLISDLSPKRGGVIYLRGTFYRHSLLRLSVTVVQCFLTFVYYIFVKTTRFFVDYFLLLKNRWPALGLAVFCYFLKKDCIGVGLCPSVRALFTHILSY